ncbi:MAG: DUF4259 domain-containing protein [Pseudomonadota bacterium]
MGAWGTGIFDNDSAADWLYEYEDQGAPAVASALSEVAETPADDYVEVDMGSWALAAGEVVAAANGQPLEVGEELMATIAKHAAAVRSIDGLPASALRAMDRVMGANSELAELWDEAGGEDEAAFQAAAADLRTRLKAIIG